MTKKKLRLKSHIKCNISITLCLMFIVFALYIFRNPFVDEYTIEAGSSLDINQLLKEEAKNPQFIDNVDQELLSTVGTYDIRVKANSNKFHVSLIVQDTTVPTATVKAQTMWIGDDIKADAFLSDIQDASPVEASFKSQPDLDKTGKQEVTIILKDSSNNSTEYKTTLTLKKDTQAPVISSVNSILSNQGESILYKKNVTVTDNRDEEVELKVDSSNVNINKAGTYSVTLSATDKTGNKAEKKIQVIILSQSEADLKAEALKLAGELIDKIASDQTTKQDKLKVCYDYIREHIVYNGLHDGTKDNYYVDAVNGLKTWKGDCLVSNAVLRTVCEKLDIPTIVVERSGERKTNHYWILADTGDGWYHYDAFKRDFVIIYKWTDNQLLTWSKENKNLGQFDPSLYPSTPDN